MGKTAIGAVKINQYAALVSRKIRQKAPPIEKKIGFEGA
jgi:hypothetical protein